jgi:hypothetical protein
MYRDSNASSQFYYSSATGSEANAVGYPSLALKLQGFCEDAFTLEQQV